MTDKELDDLFRKSFSNHEMPVPADMWQRIRQPEERKRRVAAWWWTGAAALLIAGTALWFYSGQTPSTSHKPVAASATGDDVKNTPSEVPGTSGRLTVPAPAATQPPAAASALPVPVPAGNESYAGPAIYPVNRKRETKQPKAFVSVKDAVKNTDHTVNGAALNRNSAVSRTVPGDTAAALLQTAMTPADSSRTAAGSTNTIAKAEKQSDSVSATANTPVRIKKIRTDKAISLELMVSGYGANRNVYDVKTDAERAIVSMGAIDTKEKASLIGGGFTVRIDKPVSKNISVKTGLQYLQTRQRITYSLDYVNQSGVISSFGNTDTMRFAELVTTEPTVRSTYHHLSVPLLVSYHTNGLRTTVGATGGVIMNLASWYKGNVPDGNNKNTIDAGSVFRKNNGTSLYMSVNVARNLGNWQLFAEPYAQYMLSSVTQSSARFKQKITSYGLGVGIRTRIGK